MTLFDKMTVGLAAKQAILAGMAPKKVVEIVRNLVPGCAITVESVYTYRKELRADGYSF